MRLRRIVWLLVGIGGLLLAAWAGPALWWLASECHAFCTPQPTSVQLKVANSRSVLLLNKFAEGGTVSVDYVTTVLHDEPRLCAEVWEVFTALQAQGEFATASRVILSPTDPGPRMLGATWRGPVFACCQSTGVVFRQAEEGSWDVPKGLCRK